MKLVNPFFKPKDTSHAPDYAMLLAMLAVATVAVHFLNLTTDAMMLVSLMVTLGYVVWGVTHHKKAGHIDKKIVLEYLCIAALVNVIVFTLVN